MSKSFDDLLKKLEVCKKKVIAVAAAQDEAVLEAVAGAKRQDGQSAPSYEQQTASHVEQAKAQTGFAQGSADDFSVISDNDDLPF